MIGMVLVTHGRLAAEFIAALEHVVGPQQRIAAVCIGADDDMEQRRRDILDSVAKVEEGDGVVLLTDMFGGTPSKTRSLPRRIRRSILIELASDQIQDRDERRLRLRPARRHLDIVADAGREHHQPHDRASIGGQLAALDLDLRLVLIGELDELRRRAGMQPALVQDGCDAAEARPGIHRVSLRRRPAAARPR